MYREEEFTGVTIKFEFKRTNFKKDYGTDTLVYYQTGGFGNNPDVITVDNAADESYSKWASIHECIGEFKQKGSIATKYGTRREYQAAIKAFQRYGIKVFADKIGRASCRERV